MPARWRILRGSALGYTNHALCDTLLGKLEICRPIERRRVGPSVGRFVLRYVCCFLKLRRGTADFLSFGVLA